MSRHSVHLTTLSSLMQMPVLTVEGRRAGRVRELLLDPALSASRVAYIALASPKTVSDTQILAIAVEQLQWNQGALVLRQGAEAREIPLPHDVIFLEKDLLDQQIIDVHGFKVVRVNDVELEWRHQESTPELWVTQVEVGLRGATRRLLKGLPQPVVDTLARRAQPRVIPWEFVDLIDRDPSRRVRLKVESNRLAHMHPSDIADILEELAPAERDAVFASLDEELAAEALEEVDPKLQKALLENIESERAADIVEEMDPGAAADLLSELSEERSEAILEEMEPEERQEVEELLEFPEDWAAGLMTTDYVAVSGIATVLAAIEALREFEGDKETITEIYLLDEHERLVGAVPLSSLLLAEGEKPLIGMADSRNVHCALNANGRKVAELFDKYNLRSLPVVEEDGRLAGVIHAEHVIAQLRAGK